jgi:hypothetical protein
MPSQTALEFIKSAAPRVGSAAKSQSAANPSVNADSPQETLHEASRETALLVARFEDMLKRHEARIHDCHCRCGLASTGPREHPHARGHFARRVHRRLGFWRKSGHARLTARTDRKLYKSGTLSSHIRHWYGTRLRQRPDERKPSGKHVARAYRNVMERNRNKVRLSGRVRLGERCLVVLLSIKQKLLRFRPSPAGRPIETNTCDCWLWCQCLSYLLETFGSGHTTICIAGAHGKRWADRNAPECDRADDGRATVEHRTCRCVLCVLHGSQRWRQRRR